VGFHYDYGEKSADADDGGQTGRLRHCNVGFYYHCGELLTDADHYGQTGPLRHRHGFHYDYGKPLTDVL